MDPSSISASASTIRTLHHNLQELVISTNVSTPSSPRSSALPSPPDSPSSGSVSSFPSVSSSFFFSSAAASPPPSHPHSDHGRDVAHGLIIPSLMLPDALRRPTPFGQTMGELRLLVLGSQGAGKSFLTGLLLEDNEDVVEVGSWEEAEYGKVLRASTDWVEHRDAHGLEKFEPTRNIQIVELPGYDRDADGEELIETLKSFIQKPFHVVSDVLHPHNQPSAIVGNLISSPSTPLYTALIVLLPSTPTVLDRLIIHSLGVQLPVIVLPPLNRDPKISNLSSFCPSSAVALRHGLFRSPETLALLRSEASDRFLHWREVERAVDTIHEARREDLTNQYDIIWDKSKWESEWMDMFSQDVAKRLREGTITAREGHLPTRACDSACFNASSLDPLHLPSLFIFSVSLLGPLQSRLKRTISAFIESLGEIHVRMALVGGFCVGVGFGLFVR